MNYIELKCRIEPYNIEIAEILTAELSNINFESFVDNNEQLLAYIKEDDWNNNILDSLYIVNNENYNFIFTHKKIVQQNWNKTWEEHYFKPITVGNKCVVKSSFHTDFPNADYVINIDPKMAFGTGHHETTCLMIEEILSLNVINKSILDMGCGTGILAILSTMRGAKDIIAVDYDIWSYNSTVENIKLNNTEVVNVIHGDINALNDKKYDIIYANINKNVLLTDIPSYAKRLTKDACLLLSGFYESDFDSIDKLATDCKLSLVKKHSKNNWMMLKYKNEN